MEPNRQRLIAVNATALASGGGLSILKQFIAAIPAALEPSGLLPSETCYYIFVSPKIVLDKVPLGVHIIAIAHHSFAARVAWDFWRFRRWFQVKGLTPTMIVSLQNTSIAWPGMPQVVYLHQGLSLSRQPCLFSNKSEIKLTFYRYVYPLFIFAHVRKNTQFVVQTQWMKDFLCEQHRQATNRVHVIKPNILRVDIAAVPTIKLAERYTLFYPADGYRYKNHQVLLDALQLLRDEGFDMRAIGLYLTIEPNHDILSHVKKLQLTAHVHFLGTLCYADVLMYYQSCTLLVYPSLVESFGLPLLEAAMFGKPIVAADLSYAQEVLHGYNPVVYANATSAHDWKRALLQAISLQRTDAFTPSYETGWIDFFKLLSQDNQSHSFVMSKGSC